MARSLEVNETLHVVTELKRDAFGTIAEPDAKRTEASVVGPLHGLPILAENHIATVDEMGNVAISDILAGSRVPMVSTVAAKLGQAGGIVLDTTNLSQWVNFRSSNKSNGWSPVGGQTQGAYRPRQDSWSSSSGSGLVSSLGCACVATALPSHFPALVGCPNLSVRLESYPAKTEVITNGFGNLDATGTNAQTGIRSWGHNQ